MSAVLILVTTAGCPSRDATLLQLGQYLPSSGPVPIRLLSGRGPIGPAGPFLALNLNQMRADLRRARRPFWLSQGAQLCVSVYEQCWPDVTEPLNDVLLIAANVAPDGCYAPRRFLSAFPTPQTLEVTIVFGGVCPPGGYAAGSSRDVLLAAPLDRLPRPSVLTVVLRRPALAGGAGRSGQATIWLR